MTTEKQEVPDGTIKESNFSFELRQELAACRNRMTSVEERMTTMRSSLINMNNDMSEFRHEYLEAYREIKEHLNRQDTVLADAGATSRWVRDEFSQEMRESVKTLVNPVKDLIEIFDAAKGGFKVLGWIGTGLKWLGYLAAAGTAIWGFLQLIGKPHP